MVNYIPRLADAVLAQRLTSSGAVVIEGPRASGKTETGRRAARSEVLLDSDLEMRQLAFADPSLVLAGPTPRLLDEWQTAPQTWNAVRRAVDERHDVGQFILTGSATPADDAVRHIGAGRFSRIRMRPLTLVETGHSNGEISLHSILAGNPGAATSSNVNLPDIVERMITGGWPAAMHLGRAQAVRYVLDYLDQIVRLDIAGSSDRRHDPKKVARLVRSLARNTATEVANTTLAADAGGSEGPLHPDTVARYLDALERSFVLDLQEAWDGSLRSRTPLRKAPKRHLTDTSLAAAALRIGTPDRLLGEPQTLGLFFESLVFQQLRAFADFQDSEVSHFRSASGLEIDAVVTRADGSWAAFEVKLGHGLVDEAADQLLRFRAGIDTGAEGAPSALCVIVPTGPSYVRPDGVAVIALTCLGP